MTSVSRHEQISGQLVDLKMAGALEALDEVLHRVDSGSLTGPEAIEKLLEAPDRTAEQPPVRGGGALGPVLGREDGWSTSRSSPRCAGNGSTRSTNWTPPRGVAPRLRKCGVGTSRSHPHPPANSAMTRRRWAVGARVALGRYRAWAAISSPGMALARSSRVLSPVMPPAPACERANPGRIAFLRPP